MKPLISVKIGVRIVADLLRCTKLNQSSDSLPVVQSSKQLFSAHRAGHLPAGAAQCPAGR
jgi:hypothetical protein